MDLMNYRTLKVKLQEPICFIQLYRPDANNTINEELILELRQVLSAVAESGYTVVVFEGLPQVFCFGADFAAIKQGDGTMMEQDPEPLYDLWYQMATGPFITIAHVRGVVNAGGMGFVASSDIVIADESAQFSLSELLFGLIPACVMPFLIRKIGFQKSHYLTTMTQPITAEQAYRCGLVDAYEKQSQSLLRKHLLRLRRLSKKAIIRYKTFMNNLNPLLQQAKSLALATNRQVFGDAENIAAIERYVTDGSFPWEGGRQ